MEKILEGEETGCLSSIEHNLSVGPAPDGTERTTLISE